MSSPIPGGPVAGLPIHEQISITGNLEQIHYTLTYQHSDAHPNVKLVRSRTLPFVLACRIDNQPLYMRVFGPAHTFVGRHMPPLDRAYKFYRHLVGRNKWCKSAEEFKSIVRGTLGYEQLSPENTLLLNTLGVSLVDWRVWADIIGPDGMGTIKVLEKKKFIKTTTTPGSSKLKLLDKLVEAIESDEEDYMPTPATVKKNQRADSKNFKRVKYRDIGDDDAELEGNSYAMEDEDEHGADDEDAENILPAPKRRRQSDRLSSRNASRNASSAESSPKSVKSNRKVSAKKTGSSAKSTKSAKSSTGRKRRDAEPVSPVSASKSTEMVPVLDSNPNPFMA